MYSDVVHTLYGKGPYRLHYEYKRFLLTYDQWKSLGRQERILHFKAFMELEPVRIDEEEQEEGEIASEDYDLSTAQEGDHGIAFIPLENPIDSSESINPSTALPIDMAAHTILPPQSLVPDATFAKENAASLNANQPNGVKTLKQRCIPVKPKDLHISNEIINEEVLETLFKEAQLLLNEDASITDVPSKAEDVKVVLNGSNAEPLIVKPNCKNKNLFECKCRTFSSLKGICAHTLAVSVVVNRCIDFCMEIKKKWMQTKKRGGSIPNFTAGLEHNLPLTHRGLKKNEISKVACKRSKRKQERYKTNEQSVAKASTIVNVTSPEPSSRNALKDVISSEINPLPVISTRQNITSTSVSSNVQSEQSQSTLSSQNQHTIPSNNALALTQGSNSPLEQLSASILHSSMHPVMLRRRDSLSTSIPSNLALQRLPAFTFSNQSLSTASSNHRMPSTLESGHIQYPKSTPHQFTNRDINLTASSIRRYSPVQTKLNNTSFCSFPKTAQANDSQASILFAPGPHDDTVTSLQSSCNNYLFTSTQQASYHATINNSFISNFQTPTTQCRPSSCYRFPINDTRQWSDRTLPSAPPVNPGSQLFPSQFSMSTTSTTALPGSVPQTTPQEEFPSLLNKDIEWSSSMSPYRYELVRFPSGVSKCYGCGEVFAEKYHSPLHDLIVRHKDRRIRGKDDRTGRIVYNDKFTQTYYHLQSSHVRMKNICFDNEIWFSKDLNLEDARLTLLRGTTGLNFKLI